MLAHEWARLKRGELQWVYGVWSALAIYEWCVIDFDFDRDRDELRQRAQTAIEDHVCIVYVSDAPSYGTSSRDCARILEIEATIPDGLSRRVRLSREDWWRASDLLGRTVYGDTRISDHEFRILVNQRVIDFGTATLVGGLIFKNHLAPPPPPRAPRTAEEIAQHNRNIENLRAAMARGDGEMRIDRLTVRDVTEGSFGIRNDIRWP